MTHIYLAISIAIALTLALVASVVIALVLSGAVRKATRPRRGVFEFPRLGLDLPREEIRIASGDGTELSAWFIAGARPQTVLLLHGYTACKDDMLSHAAFLHEAGYSLLLLDLRAHGASGGRVVTLGAKEREDVQAAVCYLIERPDVDHDNIGILGLSLGASLAILAACDSPAVRAVVAEAAFRSLRSVVRHNFRRFSHLPGFPLAAIATRLAEWRLKISTLRVAPDREVGRLRRCALLLIHAQDDSIISCRDSEAIFAIAHEPKELWLVPSAEHAMAYLALPADYAERVVAFFNRWLVPLADSPSAC